MKKIKILFCSAFFCAALFCLSLIGCGDYTPDEEKIPQPKNEPYYTVTYHSQGGFWGSQYIVAQKGKAISLLGCERNNYTFDGWYGEKEGGTRYGGRGDSYTVVGDITMYGLWTPVNYTVTFDTQGGQDVPQITAAYGDTITLPTPVREGYAFDGWFNSIYANAYKYPAAYNIIGDATLYAQWTQNPPPPVYTIRFFTYGVSTAYIPPITANMNEVITLPATSRSGYTFGGWYSADEGGTRYGDAQDEFTVVGDTDMYARYIPINYTVAFDLQGGQDPAPDRMVAAFGSTVDLPIPVRNHYTFDGWFSAEEGGFRYDRIVDIYDSVFNKIIVGYKSVYTLYITSDITMYARWAPINYKINFNYGYVNNNECVTSITQQEGTQISLPDSVYRNNGINYNYWAGYYFDGWFKNQLPDATRYGGAGDIYTVDSSDIGIYAQIINMYAHRTPKNLIISFSSQGAQDFDPISAVYRDTITLPTPSKNYWTFDGWFSAAEGGTRYARAGSDYTVSVVENTTMYARWTPINRKIIFDTRDGSPIDTVIQQDGTPIILHAASRQNYVFLGWYRYMPYNFTPITDSLLGFAGDTLNIDGDVTIYARWRHSNIGKKGDGNDGDTLTIEGIECVLVKASQKGFCMGDTTPRSDTYGYCDSTVLITQDFWISKYEITNAQYGHYTTTTANLPVVQVTWRDANKWAQNKNARLPTDAEWEFAARGGNKRRSVTAQPYRDCLYSGSDYLEEVGWYNNNPVPDRVGTKKTNELGIHDMSGNVWEWTNTTRVLGGRISWSYRGGGYKSASNDCRVGKGRIWAPDDSRNNDIGFRVIFPRE